MQDEHWVRAFALDDVPVGGAKLFRGEGSHVAVFRVSADELHALDNRCPHEGYPLDKGHLAGCVITCRWHNFKFDVRDGRCLMGDEAARTFPLRVRDGAIEIDVTPPDPAAELPRIWASLERGMLERKLGQMARDVVRLLSAGVTPERIALQAARFDADYAEFGTTHALPVAADVLRLVPRFEGASAVLPLMQPLDLASESHTRRPRRPMAEAIDPGTDPEQAGKRLGALVEQERGQEAEALLRGALAAGWGREIVEPWLFELCAEHFLDFGHGLIFHIKMFDLLERVGWEHAQALLPAYLVRVVNATREEALPEWLWFQRHWEGVAPRLDDLARAANPNSAFDPTELHHVLSDGERVEALDAVIDAIAAGAPLERVADAISAAAAERILRFSIAVDRDSAVQEGWLDVSHTFTFTAAVRQALRRWRSPQVIKLIMFAARFVLAARPLDAAVAERLVLDGRAPSGGVSDIVDAVAGKRASDAVALTRGYLDARQPLEPLRIALEDACLSDGLARPIFAAHALKTCIAAFDEHAAVAGPLRLLPLLAAVRMLASPMRERQVTRLCHEAVRFVVDGKVPKTLT